MNTDAARPTGNPSAGREIGMSYVRVVVLAALVGVPAAFVAAAFLGAIHLIERWLWTDLPVALGYPATPWFLILLLPALGAALVVLARRLLPGDGGSPPIEGLEARPMALAYVPGVIVAAVGTLAFGAVLGPELPVIALGSAVGIALNRFVRLDKRDAAVITNAGSFSAISALFGGPLTAGVMLVESGLTAGAALVPVLLPGLVAAGLGYLVFVGFGHFTGIPAPGLVVPDLPQYSGENLVDLAVAFLVGIVSVITLTTVRYIAMRIDALPRRFGMAPVLIVGGLSVGAIALVGQSLGADAQDILFSGQSSIGVVIVAPSVALVLVLLIAKSLAYSVSLGSGFRGGPIFPAVFTGIAIASVAVVVLGVSPTLAVSVGAAAGMAAQTRLLLSPLILATLLVGTAGLDTMPAAVIATASAWLTLHFVDARRLSKAHGSD